MEDKQEHELKKTIEEIGSPKDPLWKRYLSFAIRYILPITFTAFLLGYLFHKVNFHEMIQLLKHGVDYWWILLAMGISVFSHIFRAARWQLQLKALDIDPPFQALCCSIFGCYALNLVFPRLGELWRCTYISSYKKKSFTKVFGSMIADRAADSLMVALLFILSLIIAGHAIKIFLDKYPLGKDFMLLISQFWFWVAIVGGLVILGFLYYLLRNRSFMLRIKRTVKDMWRGIIVITKIEGKWKFLIFTLCIWICYFIQLYVAFYAFSFTRELCTKHFGGGLVPCLVAFVLSSISMALPSNGGLGPWNIAIMFGLAIYGVNEMDGTAFSMLQWSGQTVMLIILGIYTMGYISLGKNKI